MGEVGSNLLLFSIVGLGTALACGQGAVSVLLLGLRLRNWQPVLHRLVTGLMGIASVEGLLKPALDDEGVPQSCWC